MTLAILWIGIASAVATGVALGGAVLFGLTALVDYVRYRHRR